MTQGPIELSTAIGEGIRDRVFQLRALQLFTGLDDEGLTLLAEHAKPRSYRAGQVIAAEGPAVHALYFVMQGAVSLFRAGRPAPAAAVTRGIGALEYLAGAPSPRAVAESEARVLEIPAAAFQAAIEENFSLVRDILRRIGSALTQYRRSLPADPSSPPPAPLGDYYERPKTLTERMIELRGSRLGFANIDALADFARATREERYPEGHVFWSIGEQSTFSLHVNYGRVRCTAADGQSVVVGSDYTLGVMDAWAGSGRAYEARAETPIICYRILFEDFLAIVETHPHVASNILNGLSRALLATEAAQTP